MFDSHTGSVRYSTKYFAGISRTSTVVVTFRERHDLNAPIYPHSDYQFTQIVTHFYLKKKYEVSFPIEVRKKKPVFTSETSSP